ncbi:protein FAM32A-like [Histomonas meleagridis]|uniref:protein FAM32A-like n=1 Tax=Histomonas meleagridis TaxID=135588 RepID=UPI00355A60FB|nr:protein FAM32A-like [Histomonas meleagridis]KAH0797415.1 protein FAM32A-like [Histomonas meleagridis]
MAFTPGPLRLKGRKKKSAASRATPKKPQKNNDSKDQELETKQEENPDDVLNTLTDAEIRFMEINNQCRKRTIEKNASLSYKEQIEKYNEHLLKAPMHFDLEGD